jgi:LmbE family N-acetylglucosaminyl deacetylase
MPKKKTTNKKLKKYRAIIKNPIFQKVYLLSSLLIVFVTSIYWSVLGAKIQNSNADQLVNNFLFNSRSVFHGATLPSDHSFLIKWPIFWLVNVFGSADKVVGIFTVGLVLITIAALLVIIYRIESRPLVFGTICLGIASVLLMVPATPYAGAILPVNMAMITTRNIEYILYIVGLILVIRTVKLVSYGFLLSAVCLSLLVASDKLFFIFIIGSALIALIIYTRSRQWRIVSLATNWFILGLISIAASYLILGIISHSGFTHLTTEGTISPYGLGGGAKNILLGILYAAMAVFTNFGANPAFAATTVRSIPHQLFSNLFNIGGPAYLINCLVLVFGLFTTYKIARQSWRLSKGSPVNFSPPIKLTLIMIWTSIVAVLSYVISRHYYAVDARYLTIIFFTVFIAITTYAKTKKWQPDIIVAVGALLIVGILFGLFGVTKNYHKDQIALAVTDHQNFQVARALSEHHVSFIVGDYWRVVPIKQVSDNLNYSLTKAQVSANISKKTAEGQNLNITPLGSCLQPQLDQSSTAWKPDLTKTKFAYLLTLSGSLTNYPNCTLNQVTNAYGRPNASSLISGTFSHPKELLLYYDSGSHHSAPTTAEPPTGPATVLPISLAQLPSTSCTQPSVMNIVAHEDDDILFMNPDLYNDIKDGDCVHSIYITAGDAGIGADFYWLSREQGVEAAYSYMLGTKDVWVQRIVELSANEYLTIASPNSHPNIALIFMHLPDGNVDGQGFPSSNDQSLAKLKDGDISVINSVDSQSSYTSPQLVDALSTLMSIYQPSVINTQADLTATQYPDHSDHIAVDWFATQAYQKFEKDKYNDQVTIPLNHYIGYPIHGMSINLSPADIKLKENIFQVYANYDAHVCQTITSCIQNPAYGAYLTRQYTNAD